MDLTEVSQTEADWFFRLGIRPSEQTSLIRTFLIVEGLHDEWVLDELIGGELARYRARVLPIHGAKRVARHAAGAEFLYQHTDARFVFLLDNLDTSLLNQAIELARTGAGRAEVDSLFDSGAAAEQSEEFRYCRTLVTRAAEFGTAERLVGIAGLLVGDVLELLPEQKFGLSPSWADLRSMYGNRRPKEPRDFKKWVAQHFSVELDSERVIRRAAASMDSIPAALDQLRELLAKSSQKEPTAPV